MTATIGIFARPPVAGRVKTRLAAQVGDRVALDIYRACLARAIDAAKSSGLTWRVFLAEPGDDPLYEDQAPVMQQGANLGERMHHALEWLGAEFGGPGVIIGSDCPDMDAGYLRDAARALAEHELVLGPAADGGYVLIGCRQPLPALFSDVAWSGPDVLRQTLANAAALGIRCERLATRRDIDTLADLEHYPGLLELIER